MTADDTLRIGPLPETPPTLPPQGKRPRVFQMRRDIRVGPTGKLAGEAGFVDNPIGNVGFHAKRTDF
jgi:hypothetical protein